MTAKRTEAIQKQEASAEDEPYSVTKQPGPPHNARSRPTNDTFRRSIAAFLLLSSLVLAFMGQFYFAHSRQYLLDGVVLYGVAIALFAQVLHFLEPLPTRRWLSWIGSWGQAIATKPVQTTMTVLALLLAVLAGRYASTDPPPANFTPAVVQWVIAIALVIGAQLPPPATWPRRLARLGPWVRAHWLELTALAFWVLLATVLRIWRLEQIPYPLSGDEAGMGLESRRVLAGDLRNPFATSWWSHPTMWYFWQSRFMTVFGTGIVGLRIMSAIIGASTVLTLYLLAREMFGVAVAQIAVALLTAYPFHIHFSRQGLNNITDAWLSPLVFYFFYRGLRRSDHLSMALAGAALGLMQYGYLGSRVVPLIIVAYVLYLLLTEQGFLARHWRGMGVFTINALVLMMPLAFWYIHHRDDFGARLVLIGIFQSGWLSREQVVTGKSALQLLWDQVRKSLLAFNFYRDTGPHYRAPIPLLSFLPSIFFVFGVAYAGFRWRDRRLMLLLLWMVVTLLVGGALTTDPPFAPRLVVVIPAACILVALGAWKVLKFLGILGGYPEVLTATLAAVIVGVMMLGDVRFYFGEYARKAYFTDTNTEIATLAGQYLAELGSDYTVYFFGPPRMYVDFASIVYIAGRKVGVDVMEPLPPHQRPQMVQGDRHLVFIFLPERLSELETVREFFPDGEEIHFDGRFGNDLFTLYRLD